MKVSIVVPVYNVEKYLNECVDSLLKQTYKNIEIILVDDGSTDSSGNICDEYLEKYPDIIKVVHKRNEGLGYARNSGLEIAGGHYVTFVDSDDYADEDLVEVLVSAAENKKADVVIGGFKRVTNRGEIVFREKYSPEIFEGDEVCNRLFLRMLGSSPERSDAIRMSVWNALYSMRIIGENAIKFPSERVFISEDIVFDSYFYPKANRAVIISSEAYNYRVNEQSLTAKYKPDRFEKNLHLYKELEKRIIQLELGTEAIYRAQRQLFVNIRGCIRQEKKTISQKSIIEASKTVDKICECEELQKIITKYPVKKLGIKQFIFVMLLRHKKGLVLTLLSNANLF